MCSCGEGPKIAWESKPKARKTHICVECLSTIGVGEYYHVVKGVWEGEFCTFKTCVPCKKVWNEATAEVEDCICFGELWETVGVEFEYAI